MLARFRTADHTSVPDHSGGYPGRPTCDGEPHSPNSTTARSGRDRAAERGLVKGGNVHETRFRRWRLSIGIAIGLVGIALVIPPVVGALLAGSAGPISATAVRSETAP